MKQTNQVLGPLGALLRLEPYTAQSLMFKEYRCIPDSLSNSPFPFLSCLTQSVKLGHNTNDFLGKASGGESTVAERERIVPAKKRPGSVRKGIARSKTDEHGLSFLPLSFSLGYPPLSPLCMGGPQGPFKIRAMFGRDFSLRQDT
eukprot:1152215-Pelagomonas_calceolata.AAC.3